MTLSEKQRLFSKLLGEFLVWIYQQPGLEVVGGEWERTKEQAALNAAKGSGIANSLHTLCLACDLNLFVNGVYQTAPEPYQVLGEKWKSMHELCRWGGDFKTKDADHFSITHEGIE